MTLLNKKAPQFSLQDQKGDTVSLADLIGKKVVLFFYPKDNTPGCTREAQAFTALKAEFLAKNTVIYGISKDSITSHQQFISECQLGIPLLSDPEGSVCEAYGVWQEKSNYGKTSMGIVRSTFIIDENGSVQREWSNVKVDGHADAVLAAL